jgi:hypothetical protein
VISDQQQPQESTDHWSLITDHSRGDHESSFISQENLHEMQSGPAPGRDPDHLREPEAQAASGIDLK